LLRHKTSCQVCFLIISISEINLTSLDHLTFLNFAQEKKQHLREINHTESGPEVELSKRTD
jgi:hypothetical protein